MTAKRLQAVTRAMADPTRFAVLKHIAAAQPMSACSELLKCFPIAPATLSHHLKELESAGLVQTSKRGKYVDVRFCREAWERYLAALNKI